MKKVICMYLFFLYKIDDFIKSGFNVIFLFKMKIVLILNMFY